MLAEPRIKMSEKLTLWNSGLQRGTDNKASQDKPLDGTRASVSSAQATTDADKAWAGLRGLRAAMAAEFLRFNKISSEFSCPKIRALTSHFPSRKALTIKGILVYRDVLEGVLPETLAEIFAFATLSHAISEILIQRGRMKPDQILSGLCRWQECISDPPERDVFSILAGQMWPASFHLPAGEEMGQTSSHPSQGAHTLSDGQDGLFQFIRQAADMASRGMEFPLESAGPSTDSQASQVASLDRSIQELTNLTEREFGFHLLRDIGQGFDINDYSAPQGIDPTEIGRFCKLDLQIPGYDLQSRSLPIQLPSLALNFDLRPPVISSTQARCESSSPFNFQIDERISECAIFNLRNTVIFLAIYAFAKDTGDQFYLLSAGEMTVVRRKTGSAFAKDRSRAERELRAEFFGTLKKSGAEDIRFLALLAVAKTFVVLGQLATKEEVQKYLLVVSEVSFRGGWF